MENNREPLEEIGHLRKALNRHSYLYFVLDSPEVSDSEYDALLRRLIALEEAHPHLITADSPTQRVGAPPTAGFAPATHAVPLLSLANAFDEGDLRAFDTRVRSLLDLEAVRYIAEPKLDGLSVELVYRNGRLIQGSTRGGGRVGEDVTANLRTIRSVPLRLRSDDVTPPALLEVRGEVYIEREDLIALNNVREAAGRAPFANPRNLAAGSLRQLDPAVTAGRPLKIYCYDIGRAEGISISSQAELLTLLPRFGIRTNPLYRVCSGIDDAIAFYKEIQQTRDSLPYEADGVVLKVDDFASRLVAGNISRSPRWAIAGKFAAEQEVTRLRDIVVSVGRTGVQTPVAVLDPVRIRGVEISSATLHNEDEIRRKDLRIGDAVVVQRAGDVIPQIVKALPDQRTGSERPFRMPDHCVACGTPTVRLDDEVALRCPNVSCPARVKKSILHFVSKGGLDIEGLGPKLIEQLVDRGVIARLGDLFRLDRHALVELDRMGPTSAGNLLRELQRSASPSLSRFLFALGIPEVGEHTAGILANAFGSLADLQRATVDDLAALPHIGPQTAEAVSGFLTNKENLAQIDDLLDAGLTAVKVQPHGGSRPLDGVRFVFTGTLTRLTRQEAGERVKRLGAVVSAAVSKKTDYIVIGASPGSKAAGAKRLGVPTLTEEAFLDLLSRHD